MIDLRKEAGVIAAAMVSAEIEITRRQLSAVAGIFFGLVPPAS